MPHELHPVDLSAAQREALLSMSTVAASPLDPVIAAELTALGLVRPAKGEPGFELTAEGRRMHWSIENRARVC